jgi:hypothetical protein
MKEDGTLDWGVGLIFAAFCCLVSVGLASCQSIEDRQWSDLQTILEMTQPKHTPITKDHDHGSH